MVFGVNIGNAGNRFYNTASQTMESSILSPTLTYSSSYETAMEALSSLITRQSRKDRTAIGGKFSKLERMTMYIKVIIFAIFCL